jgi:hypothetical protein
MAIDSIPTNDAFAQECEKLLNHIYKTVKKIVENCACEVKYNTGAGIKKKIIISSQNPTVSKNVFRLLVYQVGASGGKIQQEGPCACTVSLSKRQVTGAMARSGDTLVNMENNTPLSKVVSKKKVERQLRTHEALKNLHTSISDLQKKQPSKKGTIIKTKTKVKARVKSKKIATKKLRMPKPKKGKIIHIVNGDKSFKMMCSELSTLLLRLAGFMKALPGMANDISENVKDDGNYDGKMSLLAKRFAKKLSNGKQINSIVDGAIRTSDSKALVGLITQLTKK